MSKTEKKHITMLAAPCSRAFIVAPEKVQEFKNHKPNSEIRRQMDECLKNFKVNNLVSKEKAKKRIKTKR